MKKKVWLIGLLFSLFMISVPGVLADGALSGVWNTITSIGSLDFLGVSDAGAVVGFTRFLIGILVFALFFALLNTFAGKDGALSFLKRNQAITVSVVLAIMSAIFMPAEVVLGIGAGWGTAVALILIGAPILGVAYLLYVIPGKDEEGKDNETKFTVFIKVILCLILFWILSAMKFHIGKLGTAGFAV